MATSAPQVLPTRPPLETNWGIALICLYVVTLLFGMGLLQVWLYFFWYPKDSWRIKAAVLLLTAVELAEVLMYMITTYDVLINNFANFVFAGILKPIDAVQYYFSYLAALIVQLYFAQSVWVLGRGAFAKSAAGVIVFLATASMSITTAVTVLVAQVGLFSALNTSTINKLVSVQTSCSVACDVLITIALFFTFKSRDTGMRGTSKILQTLTVNAINRGLLTAIFAALHMILFLAIPGQLWYFIGFKLSSQLYMNSMMATLNSREHIRRKIEGSTQQSIGSSAGFNSHPHHSHHRADLGHVEMNTVVVQTRDRAPDAKDLPFGDDLKPVRNYYN